MSIKEEPEVFGSQKLTQEQCGGKYSGRGIVNQITQLPCRRYPTREAKSLRLDENGVDVVIQIYHFCASCYEFWEENEPWDQQG